VVSAVKKPGKVSILMNLHFGQKLCKTNFKWKLRILQFFNPQIW
jgi:hypothetical protein